MSQYHQQLSPPQFEPRLTFQGQDSRSFSAGGPSFPHQQHQQAAPPASQQQLDPRFLASLQQIYPAIQGSMEAATAIHMYLTGRAQILYEEQQTNFFAQPREPSVQQQRAIESLLIQSAHNGRTTTTTTQQSQYGSFLHPPSAQGGAAMPLHLAGGLPQQQPYSTLPPSLSGPFDLFTAQQQQQQQRAQQLQQYQQQHQLQGAQKQKQMVFHPSPPELQHDASSHYSSSATESPLLSELEVAPAPQAFKFDPTEFFCGPEDGSNVAASFSLTPMAGTPSAEGSFDLRRDSQASSFIDSRAASPFGSSSSPESSFAPASPYLFNSVTLPDNAFGQEQTFVPGYHASDAKKKHTCRICHRPFARAFNLKSHMLTHDPARPKPHVCPHKSCGRGFSRAHDLERHRQGIHNDGPLHVKSQMGLVPGGKGRKQRSVRGASII